MAKRRKAPPARTRHVAQAEEHSLLLRSAESLGRVIGVLQRQLDEASRRLGAGKPNGGMDGADGAAPEIRRRKKAKKTAARPAARKRKRTTH